MTAANVLTNAGLYQQADATRLEVYCACRVIVCRYAQITPPAPTRLKRDSAVELSRIGGVNAPVGSRDPCS